MECCEREKKYALIIVHGLSSVYYLFSSLNVSLSVDILYVRNEVFPYSSCGCIIFLYFPPPIAVINDAVLVQLQFLLCDTILYSRSGRCI